MSWTDLLQQLANKVDKNRPILDRDLIFTDSTKGIMLRSPDGSYHRLLVYDTGEIFTQPLNDIRDLGQPLQTGGAVTPPIVAPPEYVPPPGPTELTPP